MNATPKEINAVASDVLKCSKARLYYLVDEDARNVHAAVARWVRTAIRKQCNKSNVPLTGSKQPEKGQA